MGNDAIPLYLGLSAITFTAGLIAWALFLNYRKRVLTGKEVIAAIEKGIDVPFPSQAPTLNYRNRGIVWTSMGLALVLVLWASSGEYSVASFGLIPTAVGVANLLIAWSNEREAGKS